MNDVISLKIFIKEFDYKLPNFNDSVEEINEKLRSINEGLIFTGYHIPFKDYKELVNKVKEIAKNSEFYNVYHSFSDANLRYYGLNEAEEKLKNPKFDCTVSQFMIQLRSY